MRQRPESLTDSGAARQRNSVPRTSGAQTMSRRRGPVKSAGISGSIRVEKNQRDVKLSTASVLCRPLFGNDVPFVRFGKCDGSNTRGDVRVNASSACSPYPTLVAYEADTPSGDRYSGGKGPESHAASRTGFLCREPWRGLLGKLKTASGTVQLRSRFSNFLSLRSVSGEIRTDIPIVIDEPVQGILFGPSMQRWRTRDVQPFGRDSRQRTK